jgi:hypothetical protein
MTLKHTTLACDRQWIQWGGDVHFVFSSAGCGSSKLLEVHKLLGLIGICDIQVMAAFVFLPMNFALELNNLEDFMKRNWQL